MAGIWVIAETTADGSLARISTELATLARSLSETSGLPARGLVLATDPAPAASDLAGYVPAVTAISEPGLADQPWAARAAARLADLVAEGEPAPDLVLIGAGPDGRDLAGALSVRLGLPVLANATEVTWSDGPVVRMSVFGGRLLTTSVFSAARGIVTVRPNAVTAVPTAAPGTIEGRGPAAAPSAVPGVAVVARSASAATGSAAIEEARVVVSGGRGVGGPEGFGIVRQLAEALGGAVGASRAAVDAGWIPYAQQVGQTGKIVRPELYLALGISGAIQHKVGMQTAGTIIAVNRDPDAPIAEFADMIVLGDLFEVGAALVEALRDRAR